MNRRVGSTGGDFHPDGFWNDAPLAVVSRLQVLSSRFAKAPKPCFVHGGKREPFYTAAEIWIDTCVLEAIPKIGFMVRQAHHERKNHRSP